MSGVIVALHQTVYITPGQTDISGRDDTGGDRRARSGHLPCHCADGVRAAMHVFTTA